MTEIPRYLFSEKYSGAHAKYYLDKHQHGLSRRISNRLEQFMVARAMKKIGRQTSILDFPCGTGRMWSCLSKFCDGLQIADNSRDMIETGLVMRPAEITSKIAEVHHCSAFNSGLSDNRVDCVVSIRFMHHIQQAEDRIAVLREFRRISRRYVLVSLWVDGNYRAWHQLRRQRQAQDYHPRDRLIIPRKQFEAEVAEAGLTLLGYSDMLPGYEKWRTYILEV